MEREGQPVGRPCGQSALLTIILQTFSPVQLFKRHMFKTIEHIPELRKKKKGTELPFNGTNV
jgi:hypothetical protein